MGARRMGTTADACRASVTGTAPSSRPHITGRLGLAFACVAILLIGAATGCSSGSSSAPESGVGSTAGGQPVTSQSRAAPIRGAATNLDYSQGVEDPTSVSCPSAGFCMAVLESGYAATYDGTAWSRPTRLSSSGGEPDSVSCPTVSFCMAVDARDSSTFLFNGSTWSSAPRINDLASSTPTGMASVSCSSPSFCAAVDNGSNAFTFNRTSWSPAAVIDPGNELSTVSCPSPRFCAAVDYGPNVVTFNGTSWSKPSAIDPACYLQAVSCASVNFCVAVDRKGTRSRSTAAPGARPSTPIRTVSAWGRAVSPGLWCLARPATSAPSSTATTETWSPLTAAAWTAPVNIDSKAANSDKGPVLIFLMSVSCRSARFCVAGDSIGDAFVRS